MVPVPESELLTIFHSASLKFLARVRKTYFSVAALLGN
jgi:hypothetical protein